MPTHKRFSHVIFDLDGTVLDTLDDLANSVNWVLTQHGWPTHERDTYKYFVGNGMVKLLERATPEQAKQPGLWEQVQEEFHAYYAQHKADCTKPYDGMERVLNRLKEVGVSIAVLTNKPNTAAQPIMEQYYPGVFPLVQGAMPQLPVKPDPTVLMRLMERMGANPESTLFVGDSNVDIQTAKNGGLSSCGVLWGFRTRQELEEEGAQFIAQTPDDLLNIILEER
ncbi:MAG: HAD family hydrolase [Ruminococcaceae bacterium]|nr:HAD family hydrolase [Oscillospiraceae bacterium]